MSLDDETRLYIKDLVDVAMASLSKVLAERDARLREVEKKVFNGFGNSIKILFMLHGLMIGLLIKAVFF